MKMKLKLKKLWKIKIKKTAKKTIKGGKPYKTEKTSYYVACSYVNADGVPPHIGRDDASGRTVAD
jgi:hypothetical protein